ncbi:MAG: hypothetical protein ABSE07_12420 [Methanoregula sp.]
MDFLKKGFKEDRGRKDIFYYFYYNGKKSHIFTKMSHNPGDLDEWHISQMATQIKLTKKQFVDLVDCPLLEKDLIEIYLIKKELF